MAGCYRDLSSTVWQSVVEFRLLTSVCKAMKENAEFMGMGKNAGRFQPFVDQSS